MTGGASRPKINLPALLTLFQIVSTVGNINWKGYATMFNGIKTYWGRIILVGLAVAIVGLVLYDWRRAHLEMLEAEQALVVAQTELATMRRDKAAELVARAERAETLATLSEEQVKALAEVKDILDANSDYASQRVPDDLRRRLRE